MKTNNNRHDPRTLEESYLLQKENNQVLRKNNELLEENNRLLKDTDSKLRKIAINTS
jgi:cell division protein FtsB